MSCRRCETMEKDAERYRAIAVALQSVLAAKDREIRHLREEVKELIRQLEASE